MVQIMKINEHGFWENSTSEGHEHDEGLAQALLEFFHKEGVESVVDFGCGDGYYTKFLNANKVCTLGFDGNPNTPQLTDGQGYVLDLTHRHSFGSLDWVLSLEVGEHIPAEYEKTFIENLDKHNKYGIILSWAIKGQGGDGHVNCKDNHEVIDTICSLGYDFSEQNTTWLRSKCATFPHPGWWFRNTLMVFRKKKP
jgi:methyltransferase family protein